jgi:hypothetical protein
MLYEQSLDLTSRSRIGPDRQKMAAMDSGRSVALKIWLEF